jgi:MinD superfamily P-loop ATPase
MSIIKALNLRHHIIIDRIPPSKSVDSEYFKNGVSADYTINIPYCKILLENYLGKY